jgi:membrane-associated phospholipid phosphatase
MKRFLSTLPLNLVGSFKGRMIAWHGVAILFTFIAVVSGLDWFYFRSTRSDKLWAWMIPSAPIGGLVPLTLPLVLLALGSFRKGHAITTAGWAIGQAEIIGGIIAAAYKAVTGRVHPSHGLRPDISQGFRFGFLRGGVFWGWPSSHTTIAFAMAGAVFTLFQRRRWLGLLAIAYALYIGVGVSMTIHWLSDFVAGAVIGSVVGRVVGKSFLSGISQGDLTTGPDVTTTEGRDRESLA